MIYYFNKECNLDLLEKEIRESSITVALDSVSQNAQLEIAFKASLSVQEEQDLSVIVDNHDASQPFEFPPQTVSIANSVRQLPFADKTYQGNSLFMRIHGIAPVEIGAGLDHAFEYTVTYPQCKITCAEIINDVQGSCDFEVHHPIAGKLNQFGFNVNVGNVYKRESAYDADLFQGLIVKIKVKNETSSAKVFAVNVILHEVRP
jgi:hypothetical protein